MTDPWVPSIDTTVIVGPSTREYPTNDDFTSKSRLDQEETLVDCIVQNSGTTLQQILKLTGATRKQFYDITSSEDFPKKIFDRSIQDNALVKLPHVVSAVVDGAVLGQDQKIKMFLQMLKCVDKDETTINVSLQQESSEGLRNRLENLMERLKLLDSQEKGSIIDADVKQLTDSSVQEGKDRDNGGDVDRSPEGGAGQTSSSRNDSVVVGGSIPRTHDEGSEEEAGGDGQEDEDEVD